MAKSITSSFILILLIAAIMNGHIEAARRDAETAAMKDGGVNSNPQFYGQFPFPPPPPPDILTCVILYKLCWLFISPCPAYYNTCIYNHQTAVTESDGSKAQSVAISPNVP